MKKAIALTMLLALMLSLLSACGGSSSGGGNSTDNTAKPASNNSTTTNNAAAAPAKTVVVPDAPLDIEDRSIYFVVIDGVKYQMLESTVQDFLDNGFTFEVDDENQMVEPMDYGGLKENYGSISMLKDGKTYFTISADNYSDNAVPVKECLLTGIFVNRTYADITFVNNLAIGCTVDDMFSVFGEIESHYSNSNNAAYAYSVGLDDFYFSEGDYTQGFYFGVDITKEPAVLSSIYFAIEE